MSASQPIPVMTPALFREAMSRVASTVHVVATSGVAGRSGATATAVTSVSDKPPSLLVCLNQESRTLAAIRENKAFSVHALAGGMETIGGIFSGQGGMEGDERFTKGGAWTSVAPMDQPRLGGALAGFQCRLTDLKPVGSHIVVIGEVVAVEVGEGEAALLYAGRRYRQLLP